MRCYFLVLFAALCTAGANLCIRKNLDDGGSTEGCLVVFFAMSLLASILSQPLFAANVPFSPAMLILGMIGGIFIAAIMMLTSKALDVGPSGLTFAFQNSASVLPSLALALLFGSEYGFIMTPGLLIGLGCVIGGLFLAAISQKGSSSLSKKWLSFAISLFLLQSLLLTLFHWRCLLQESTLPSHSLIPFMCKPEEEAWFMPGIFLAATLVQSIWFAVRYRRRLRPAELKWGIFGGAGNGASTYFLLYASAIATASEKGIAFPLFAVGVIVLCNLWGQRFYGEKVSWKANALCMAGILIAGA